MPSEAWSPSTADHPLARRVRVSVTAPSAEVLAGRLDWLAELGCRAELRLDLLPADVDLAALQRRHPALDLLAAWPDAPAAEAERAGDPRPAIADAARVAALRAAAEAGLPWVDLPEALADVDLPSGRRVRSWHGAGADVAAAAAAAERLAARAGAEDVVKLVTTAEYAEDALPVLALGGGADADGGAERIAFAQGPGGEATRQLCLRAGAPWTYAAWGREAVAPGQPEVHALLEELPRALDGPLYGVAGDPAAQSRSPELWAAALRRCGLDGFFLRFRVRDFAAFLGVAAAEGLQALAVTAPHKTAALAAAGGGAKTGVPEAATAAARAAGAANLLRRVDGGWQADNTDGYGALEALCALGFRAGEVLILGAGGAARACAAEALRRGHPVRLAARDPRRAEEAAALLRAAGPEVRGEALVDCELAAAAVVQATPLGTAAVPGDPLGGRALRPDCVALDMVYGPTSTPFLRAAQASGAAAADGRAMLVAQMTAQFRAVTAHEVAAAEVAPLLVDRRSAPGIALVGARGSGKTTLGRWLATVLGRPFLDADAEYAARHGEPVAAALERDAADFRRRERELLEELARRTREQGAVLATGGGCLAAGPVDLGAGTVCWLEADAETLAARQAAAPRPRLRSGTLLDEVRALLAERSAGYAQAADVRVRSDGTEAAARAALIAALVRNSRVSSCYR